jgi:hypothetical protein
LSYLLGIPDKGGQVGEMRYLKPTAVSYKDKPDGKWVEVYFGDDEDFVWVPALKDLAEILAKIGKCEDEKYEWPTNNVKGAEMVIEFIKEAIILCLENEKELNELCDKYKIPK